MTNSYTSMAKEHVLGFALFVQSPSPQCLKYLAKKPTQLRLSIYYMLDNLRRQLLNATVSSGIKFDSLFLRFCKSLFCAESIE